MVLKGMIFNNFPFGEDVVVLKGVILNNFEFGKVLWSLKDCF